MTPEIISLIITGLAVVIILFQVLIGAIRGLRKSTFRLLWIFGWGIICVFLATIIARSVVNIDVSFLGIKFRGELVTSLPTFVRQMLESSNPDMADMIASNPKLMELCTSIASMFLSLLLFEILFWATKILLWPIWAIISHVLYGRKKVKSEDGLKPVRKLPKPKKYAGFGALVGLGLGLIVCMFTFVPLHFINAQVMAIETETATEESGNSTGVISEMLGPNYKFLRVYEDSYIEKVFKYTGISLSMDLMSNVLTSATFEGERISLTKEFSGLAPVYRDYKELTNFDFSNLNKEDIASILTIVDDMQSRVLTSSIVRSVYNEVAPYLAKNIVTNPDYFIKLPHFDNDFLNSLIKDTVKAFFGVDDNDEIDETKLINMSDISNDVSKVIDMVEILNQTNIVSDIVNKRVTFNGIRDQLTTQLGENLVNKFFEMRTISTLLPVVIEPSIEYATTLAQSFDYGAEEGITITYTPLQGGLTSERLNNFLSNFVTNAIEVVKGINLDSKLYVSGDKLSYIGAIIDILSSDTLSPVSTETYNSALNYGLKFANKYIDYQFPNIVPEDPDASEYQDPYNVIGKTLVSAITDIDQSEFATFSSEFGKLTGLFNFVSGVVNSEDIETEIQKRSTIMEAANKLDALIDVETGSLIFSKTNCVTVMQALVDKFGLGEFDSYKETIKANIAQVDSFEDELEFAFGFMDAEIDNINGFKTYLRDNLLAEDQETGVTYSKSKLISMNLIYDIAIDYVPTVSIHGVNLTEDIKAQLELDKERSVNIISVIEQVEEAQHISYDTTQNVEDMDLIDLGQQIDNLVNEFDLVFNQSAVDKIGDKVAEIINDKVQEMETPDGMPISEWEARKANVQSIYNDKDNSVLYPNFETLFTAINNALFN